jgi:hypothetical protein
LKRKPPYGIIFAGGRCSPFCGTKKEMVKMADAEYRVLRTREERIAFARSMNLFSTPFMRVVFKDEKATQYVLRILTGKPDLKIIQNLT